MALKINLKSGERVIINGAEVGIGNRPGELLFYNHARILRQKDFLPYERIRDALVNPDDFSASDTWLYYLLQLVYISPDNTDLYFEKITAAIQSLQDDAPHKAAEINEIIQLVADGDIYKAMRAVKKAFPECLTPKSIQSAE